MVGARIQRGKHRSLTLLGGLLICGGLLDCGGVPAVHHPARDPWDINVVRVSENLDVIAREPMVASQPDGTLFVAGYGEPTPTLWRSRDRGVNRRHTATRGNAPQRAEQVEQGAMLQTVGLPRSFFAPRSATPLGRLCYIGSMAAALVSAGLEMSHVHGGIITSYGADLFGTMWFYAIIRLRGSDRASRGWAASPARVAAVTFALGAASEVAQRLELLRGTYDVFDIVTFALAVSACATIEYVFGPFRAPERSAAPA